MDVPRRELLQALDDLLLREWVAELERPVETNAAGMSRKSSSMLETPIVSSIASRSAPVSVS